MWFQPRSKLVLSSSISLPVRNRNVFLAIVAVVAALKLLFCAVAPASFDLQYITEFASRHIPVGPWIALYPPLYMYSASNASLMHEWVVSPPTMSPNLMQVSLLFRLPILAVDIATMIAVYYTGKNLGSSTAGRLASLIWFANPYSLFAIEGLGVPDVLATLLIVVAFNLLLLRRPLLSGACLGLGVCVKFFPILLIPAFILFAHRYGSSRKYNVAILFFGLVGLAGYMAWAVFQPPFALDLQNPGYLATYSPVTQPLPFVGSSDWFSGAFFVLILFYSLLGIFRTRAKNILGTLLLTILVYYALSNPYPQYFVWAMPLMALDIAFVDRSRTVLFAATYLLAFAQWFLTSALITPSGYSLLMIQMAGTYGSNVPWYFRMLGDFLQSQIVASLSLPLVRSGLFASVVIYALDIVRSWF